jgi:Septum formation
MYPSTMYPKETKEAHMTTTDKLWTRALAVTAITAASILLSGCSILNAVTGGGGVPVDTNPSDGTTGDAFSVTVGDCIDQPTQDAEGNISEVTKIDCAKAHDQEIFKSIIMPASDFPGDDAVNTAASDGCRPAFQDFVGISYDDSKLALTDFQPTQDSWNDPDFPDREILCIVYDDGVKTTGTLAGAAR